MRACKLGRGGGVSRQMTKIFCLSRSNGQKVFDYDWGDMSLVLMKTVFCLV